MHQVNSGLELQGGSAKVDSQELSLADRVRESTQLRRFFWKLFREATQLRADSATFTIEGTELVVALNSGTEEKKRFNIKSSWFEPTKRWLSERNGGALWAPENATLADKEYWASVRLEREVVVLKVGLVSNLKVKDQLQVSIVNQIPILRAVENFGLLDLSGPSFEKMLAQDTGLVIISAPDDKSLSRSLAAVLSVGYFNYGGDISRLAELSKPKEFLSRELVVLSHCAPDLVDSFLKIRELGINFVEVNSIGAMCQGFVRSVCKECARESVIDKAVIDSLPIELRPKEESVYHVGRGCKSCNQTGYKGLIGIQSVLQTDSEMINHIAELLGTSKPQGALVDFLYPKGVRPLLEDGLRKVFAGKVTFEALFELTRTCPDAYLKLLRKSESAVIEHVPLVEVGDQSLKTTRGVTAKPKSGPAAFRDVADPGDDDGPLFAVRRSGKPRSKPLLLVVEDDSDQRNILEMVLKNANYDVVMAFDGALGWAALEKDPPDLIITDLMMPNMNGAELVSKIKGHPSYKNIPVLVLTVVSDADKEFALLDSGADDYCEKTIQRKILLKRVENLLKRTKQQGLQAEL